MEKAREEELDLNNNIKSIRSNSNKDSNAYKVTKQPRGRQMETPVLI